MHIVFFSSPPFSGGLEKHYAQIISHNSRINEGEGGGKVFIKLCLPKSEILKILSHFPLIKQKK